MNPDIQLLVASRLEDLADQVHQLYTQGMIEEAKLLRDEGLALAHHCDEGYTFMYLPDFSETT